MRRARPAPRFLALLGVAGAVAVVALALVLRGGDDAADRSAGGDGAGSAEGRAEPVRVRVAGAPIDLPPPEPQPAPVRYRDPEAVGLPYAGRLVRGTRLPVLGRDFRTWDPVLKRVGSRAWRRYGTDDMVRMVLRVARQYARAEPRALPILVGDLSRTRGGDFGPQFGFIGHSSHQNGLDADIYYPRRDGRQPVPKTVDQVDRRRAQRLVDLFVAAGAETVLVGPNVDLTGPPGVVKPYPNHDNHLHVRIRNPG